MNNEASSHFQIKEWTAPLTLSGILVLCFHHPARFNSSPARLWPSAGMEMLCLSGKEQGGGQNAVRGKQMASPLLPELMVRHNCRSTRWITLHRQARWKGLGRIHTAWYFFHANPDHRVQPKLYVALLCLYDCCTCGCLLLSFQTQLQGSTPQALDFLEPSHFCKDKTAATAVGQPLTRLNRRALINQLPPPRYWLPNPSEHNFCLP